LNCKVILHAILRDKLPSEAHGRADMVFAEGSTIRDVATKLGLPPGCQCAVNEQIEKNVDRPVKDGDVLRFFRASSGGSVDSHCL
jgi:sulfur carrier protein ThiS